jgi:hypothetical protein
VDSTITIRLVQQLREQMTGPGQLCLQSATAKAGRLPASRAGFNVTDVSVLLLVALFGRT